MNLEPADPIREQVAREVFPFDMSPDEYAARYAHRWMLFNFDDYAYSDPVVHAWVHRLGAVLRGVPGTSTLEALREQLLSAEEREAIAAEVARDVSDDEGY
jgi:hypothetical protein